MAWFVASSSYPEFQEKVEKATSESIPNGDIDFAVALEVTDLIRSKQIPGIEAMRIIKDRFFNASDSNIQNSALKLSDFCIKNGGENFVEVMMSNEFLNPFYVFLKQGKADASVKNYILENIQNWSIMLSNDPKFEQITKTYEMLQKEGYEFPAVTDVFDKSMVHSKVAPDWKDSDACMLCSKKFSFLNRKHHCRSCGGVFCGQHSDKTIELPELGITIAVRVCDTCFFAHHGDEKKRKKKHKHRKNSSVDSDQRQYSLQDEDQEIKRAIELSLNNTSTNNAYGLSNLTSTVQPTLDDDDDDDIKAAIQASLQELNNNSSLDSNQVNIVKEPEPVQNSTGLYSNLMTDDYSLDNISFSKPVQQQQQQQQPRRVDYITSQDEKNIIDFVDGIHKVQTTPPNQRYIDSNLTKLHSDMVLLHPKVGNEIIKTQKDIETFQSLYSKLFAINRLYDDILQTRFQQEQERLQMQYTQQAMFSPPAYKYPHQQSPYSQSRNPMYNQASFISPQPTFGQAPQVYQLEQTTGIRPSYTQIHSIGAPSEGAGTSIGSNEITPQSLQQKNSTAFQVQHSGSVQHFNQASHQSPPVTVEQSEVQQSQARAQQKPPLVQSLNSPDAGFPPPQDQIPIQTNILPSLDSLSYAPLPDFPTAPSTQILEPLVSAINPISSVHVQSAPKPESESKLESLSKPESEPKSESELKPESEIKVESEIKLEPVNVKQIEVANLIDL